MIKEKIRILIDKFYNGETTVEEEHFLFQYFKEEEVIPEFKKYKPHFELISYSKSLQVSEDFKKKFEENKTLVKVAKNNHPLHFKIAASLAFLLVAGLLTSLLFDNIFKNKISLKEFSTKKNQQKTFTLPDGSKVWLNSSSNLKFSKTFKAINREVILEGEAFFEVAKDKQHPFIIKTGNYQTEALGTSFNIRSYASEEIIEVVVVTGKVAFGSRKKEFSKQVFLLPSNGVIFNKTRNRISKTERADPNLIAWKTHKLVFEDTPMNEVAKLLSDYFSEEIKITDPKILKCRFKGTFKEAELLDIMKVLNYSMGITAHKTGNKYILIGKGCN